MSLDSDLGTGLETGQDTGRGDDVLLTDEHVVAISTDVWDCFLDAANSAPLVAMPEETGEVDEDHYVAVVTVTGAWNGHIILELPTAGGRPCGAADARQSTRSPGPRPSTPPASWST